MDREKRKKIFGEGKPFLGEKNGGKYLEKENIWSAEE